MARYRNLEPLAKKTEAPVLETEAVVEEVTD